MGWGDEKVDGSVTGGILRAVGTGMLIVCLGFAAKAAFGGGAMVVDHLLSAGITGLVGTAAMVGAAAADRECVEAEEAEDGRRPGEESRIASPGTVVGLAEVEAAEGCERRFASRPKTSVIRSSAYFHVAQSCS